MQNKHDCMQAKGPCLRVAAGPEARAPWPNRAQRHTNRGMRFCRYKGETIGRLLPTRVDGVHALMWLDRVCLLSARATVQPCENVRVLEISNPGQRCS